jgi:hypothetical protein
MRARRKMHHDLDPMQHTRPIGTVRQIAYSNGLLAWMMTSSNRHHVVPRSTQGRDERSPDEPIRPRYQNSRHR